MLGKHKGDTMSENDRIIREAMLKDWVNTQSKGEEGFTPMHFASFHGNLALIKLLISYGGNIEAKNR